MKVDFYPTHDVAGRPEPDLEHELPAAEARARARRGETVLVKVWLRTNGAADLERLEERLGDLLAPLGLK